jgi:hypothetical protein
MSPLDLQGGSEENLVTDYAVNHGHGPSLVLALIALSFVTIAACHPPIKSTLPNPPPDEATMAQLWMTPDPGRDLYWGVGGKALAPDPSVTYTVIEVKTSGFSKGYTVTGPANQEWSAKFPPEASTEVVASRLHWGIGYHQPPIYYVPKWQAEKAPAPNPQLSARFRQHKPNLHGLDAKGVWSYYQNPFVGTPQLQGLLVLQAMLGNSDIKDDNNALYHLSEPFEGAQIWYVPRDLGHTFGRTGVLNAPRGDIDEFEKTPFIKGVTNGRVKLDWRGRHGALFDNIKPAEVRWICERLQALTDAQLEDAFRAGGYTGELSQRFIRRLKQKIAEGAALKD